MLKPRTWWSLSFLIATGAIVALVSVGCSHSGHHAENRDPAAIKSSTKYGDRGSPAEYDSGAPKENSKWFELYGAVPNYRSIGVVALGGTAMSDEKFRWQMGPMWYRGRLARNGVKAFIVGQEGAQDENVSNRAFTGSTGTRVQKFLKHMGIHRSYLFMNTFVYTINGQLDDDPNFKWLEQGENSPIVNYRHSLFDYMLETNSESVALFMGIGAGGKASVATWVRARGGGKCRAEPDLQNCDTSKMAEWFLKNKGITIKNKILAVGVPHPGGANPNLGGADQLQNIIAGFTNSAKRVAAEKNKNPNWLPKDIDEKLSDSDLLAQMNSPFKYGHGAIPFRDFAFNTNWRMGAEGTTSNRWGADSIQVFSDAGVYNDKTSKFRKPKDLPIEMRADRTGPKEMRADELAYESPKSKDYDFGPCKDYYNANSKVCDLANLLVSWPNMADVGVKAVSHESLGYTGTYRGRALDAQVFILADQTSQDDIFSTRALTGAEGQRLNKMLALAGAGTNYFILRTFPVDTLGRSTSELISGATNPAMISQYKNIYAEVKKVAPAMNTVVAFGPVAIAAARAMKMNAIELASSSDLNSWNAAADQIAKNLGTKKSGVYKGELAIIPRIDLPYHTRWWMGTSGDRADRGEGAAIGDYYRVWAPEWVENLPPRPIDKVEGQKLIQARDSFKNSFFQ